MEEEKVLLMQFESQIKDINTELKIKDQLIKLNEKCSEKELVLNKLNTQKDIKDKILLLNLDIEKINFEIESKQNDLTSLKNLKIQINKSINFQKEILDNSKKELLKLIRN